MRNCPFYGVSLVQLMPDQPPVFMTSGGNQCALIMTAHAPCAMEIAGVDADWDGCARNPANNGSYTDPVSGTELGQALGTTTPQPDTPETVAEKMKGALQFGARFEALGRREEELKRVDPGALLPLIDGAEDSTP